MADDLAPHDRPGHSTTLLMTHPSSAFGTFSPRGGEKGLDAYSPSSVVLPACGENVPKADEGLRHLRLHRRLRRSFARDDIFCGGSAVNDPATDNRLPATDYRQPVTDNAHFTHLPKNPFFFRSSASWS